MQQTICSFLQTMRMLSITCLDARTKVHQSKVYTGSVAIKSTSREFTMKSTARECHNQKYCQGLSHEKVLPGSASI